jgi:beta-galactosidase
MRLRSLSLLLCATVTWSAEPVPAAHPLPVFLPAEHPLPDLPPALTRDEVVVDLGAGQQWRPAVAAPEINLDGTWRCSGLTTAASRFADDAQLDKGYQDPAFDDTKWDEIAVPLDWYRRYPKARNKATPFVLGWYRRSLDLTPRADATTVLHFGVIGYAAELWVNGKPAGSHHGDFTPWDVDISDLVTSGRNVLALRVRSDLGPSYGAGPAWHAYGSQWSPDNIKGGLWQSCALRQESRLRVTELLVSPQWPVDSAKAKAVRVDWHVDNRSGKAQTVRLRAVVQGARRGGEAQRSADLDLGEITLAPGDNSGTAVVPVSGIALWTPEAPQLHFLSLLLQQGTTVAGGRCERFGFRNLAIKDGGFTFNDVPLRLLGENLAAKNYGGLGETPAAFAAHIDNDLSGFKRNGYVIVRNAHMPLDPAVLSRADELGLMIYDEWAWSFTKDLDAQEFPKRNAVEIAEWVRRDYNHPAVVMWSCGNEVHYDGADVQRELDLQVAAVKALDHSGRPVSTFSGAAFGYGTKPLATEVFDLHDYLGLSGQWTNWPRNAAVTHDFLVKTYGAERVARTPFIVWEAVGFSWGHKPDPSYHPGDVEAYVRYANRSTSWGQPEGIGFAGTIGLAAALDPARGLVEGRRTYGRRIGEYIRSDARTAGFAPWFQDPDLAEARQWTQKVFAALAGPSGRALRHPIAGSTVIQRLLVVNDAALPLTGARAVVTVVGSDGVEHSLTSVPVPDLAVGARNEQDLTLTVPNVAEAGWLQVRVRVEAAGVEVSRLGYDWYVAPATLATTAIGSTRKIALLPGGDVAAVQRYLSDLGVAVKLLPEAQITDAAQLGDAAVVIVPPNCPVTGDAGFILRGWVREGGDLLVLEQAAGEVAALRQTATLAGQTFVDLAVPTHPLFAGLDQMAFDTSDLAHQGLWVQAGMVPLTANVLAARGPFLGDAGASAVISEGALGRGRLLVSQLLALGQWRQDSVATVYLRNLAQYLLLQGSKPAAGIRPWQEVASGVAAERCKPLDLRSVANRGFADDTADDGKGGWTDQGGNDFRMMPLGAHLLQGVPFTIIDPASNSDRSCLVLGGAGRPTFPRTVEGIAVGGQVARLFFLHTAAWLGRAGAVAMTYRVHYADGQVLEIPVRAGTEIADWWNPCDLPGARLGMSRTNDQLREVGLFLMPWENPRPQVAITSLDVVSPGTMVPIVVAITAEAAHAAPMAFKEGVADWAPLTDRPHVSPERGGPGSPVVTAATETAPSGAAAVRLAFPAPSPDAGDSQRLQVPAAFVALPPTERAKLADPTYRYVTFWLKAEGAGALDLVLPRQDWKDALTASIVLDPAKGWHKVRLALGADMQLGRGKKWEFSELRGELFLFNGRSLPLGSPLPPAVTVLVAEPRLE